MITAYQRMMSVKIEDSRKAEHSEEKKRKSKKIENNNFTYACIIKKSSKHKAMR